MTNDGQTKRPHDTASSRHRGTAEGYPATDDSREGLANHGHANWAWANGRSGYDWMDSHYLVTDVA